MTQTFDRDANQFPFNELEWAQMMLLAFEKWDIMPQYEEPDINVINGIEAIMKPTTLQDALNTIRKKDLKIEQLEN